MPRRNVILFTCLLTLAYGCATPVSAEIDSDAAPIACTDDAGTSDVVATSVCDYDEDAFSPSPSGWPAGTCFHGKPPEADAFVAPLPEAVSCEAVPPTFFSGQPVPAPTLTVELGHLDPDSHAFLKWQDGDFAPIAHGAQGGMHVGVAIRVPVPGVHDCLIKLQTRAVSYLDCVDQGLGQMPTMVARAVAVTSGEPAGNVYVGPSSAIENQVRFGLTPDHSWEYCGKVLEMRVQVRVPGTDRWGEGRSRVRLFDLPAYGAKCLSAKP